MKRTTLSILIYATLGTSIFAQNVLAQNASTTEPVKRIQGNLVLENVPQTPESVREKLIQYNNTRAAGFGGFAPDGTILIGTRFGETSQVHKVAQPMGARSQLTYFPETVSGITMRPFSDSFVFRKDKGGDEFFQFHTFDMKNGKIAQFTETGTRNEGLNFSKDGKNLAWTVSRSGQPTREIVIASADDPKNKKIIATKTGGWSVLDFSPDGKSLLVGEYISVTKSKRAILNIETGEFKDILPEMNVSFDGGQFSADGKSIYLLTDENSDSTYGVRINLATGTRTRITPRQNWDVEGLSLSPNGQTLLYVVNENGLSKLYSMATTVGARTQLINLPIGVVGGLEWSADSRKIGLSLSTASAPSDAYTYELASRALTRWTQSEIGGLNPASFVTPRLIEYPTFDSVNGKKRTIPAFVYEPKTAGPHPVIIQIHGGPESQSRPNFSSTIQYWVNELGAAVIVPNVRGSTGYGKAFVDLDNGFKREDSVKDIGALLDWVATQPKLNKNKVAVYGGSYGGYMVLASMTNFNDRLAGGVDIVGISHFSTFLQNTQGYRVDLRRVEYGDERDAAMRAFHEKIAPLNNAHKITKPMFVIQGANDPRVPQSEAEQMVAKMRANGGKVWYMIGKDEGHGFAKKSNRDAQREAETLFFKEIFGN